MIPWLDFSLIWIFISTAIVVEGAVLFMSFDGFRWRYLCEYRNETSWFHYLKRNGASSSNGGMRGTFTTKTFPSHVTLSTGLYQESHGIVSNVMYDPQLGRNYSYKRKSDNTDPIWWKSAVPIWITAEEQGKKSATFFWPGSESSYNGISQSYRKYYNKSVPFEERVDTAVKWLTKDNVQFVSLYVHEPDNTAHRFGPNSDKTRQAVSRANGVLDYLIRKLKQENIFTTTNIVIVADHGMSECPKNRIIPIFQHIEKRRDLYKFLVNSQGPILDFVVEPSKIDSLYNFLKDVIQEQKYDAVKVYKKSDMPERLHYKNNPRIPDVLLLAEEGYYLVGTEAAYTANPIPDVFGCHGYDNAYTNMEPIFIAHGPDIANGTVLEPFNQVDVYNLLAKLLHITPRPNNGTWSSISKALKNP